MRLCVISDLHLGADVRTDIFGHDDAEFLKFLSFLESNFERIVLLGDIWETLTVKGEKARVSELQLARERHREIARRFEKPQYSYIHGNHDLVASSQGAPSEMALQVDGLRLLFSHGHQGDEICHNRRYISEWGVWAGAWLRRFGWNAAYSYFASMEHERASGGEVCAVKKWALDEANCRKADVVVTGHTHVPAKSEDGDCLFLNSGSCAEGELSFLSLDTRGGNYELHAGY